MARRECAVVADPRPIRLKSPLTQAKQADIVLPAWNKLNLTKRAIQSIRDSTTAPYRLIVIDNGCTDGTATWLAKQEDIKRVIAFEENQGFTAAMNAGLAICTSVYIVMFSNDVEVDTGWLKLLIEGLESDPKIGAIGPLSTAKPQVQWEGRYRGQGGVQLVPYELAFFCTLFRAKAMWGVGGLDEKMPVYGSDNDYCYRMRLAGWELALHCDVLVKHDHPTITPAQERLRNEATLKLREKWPEAHF